MWRNADMLDMVGWLRAHNDRLARDARRVGLYGLDLYSLGASIESVIGYLDTQDPDAAARARTRYECLQRYGAESTEYGRAVVLGVGEPCRRRVIEQLVELRRRAGDYLRRDGLAAEDEYFFAEQNATVVANAEEYYRTMFGDQAAPGICATGTWPIRSTSCSLTSTGTAARRGWWYGGTTRTSATRAPPRWGRAASSTSGS